LLRLVFIYKEKYHYLGFIYWIFVKMFVRYSDPWKILGITEWKMVIEIRVIIVGLIEYQKKLRPKAILNSPKLEKWCRSQTTYDKCDKNSGSVSLLKNIFLTVSHTSILVSGKPLQYVHFFHPGNTLCILGKKKNICYYTYCTYKNVGLIFWQKLNFISYECTETYLFVSGSFKWNNNFCLAISKHRLWPSVHAHFKISCRKYLIKSFSVECSSGPSICSGPSNNAFNFS